MFYAVFADSLLKVVVCVAIGEVLVLVVLQEILPLLTHNVKHPPHFIVVLHLWNKREGEGEGEGEGGGSGGGRGRGRGGGRVEEGEGEGEGEGEALISSSATYRPQAFLLSAHSKLSYFPYLASNVRPFSLLSLPFVFSLTSVLKKCILL